MTHIATLIEHRRVLTNVLNDGVKKKKREREKLEKIIKALDWAIGDKNASKKG